MCNRILQYCICCVHSIRLTFNYNFGSALVETLSAFTWGIDNHIARCSYSIWTTDQWKSFNWTKFSKLACTMRTTVTDKT